MAMATARGRPDETVAPIQTDASDVDLFGRAAMDCRGGGISLLFIVLFIVVPGGFPLK